MRLTTSLDDQFIRRLFAGRIGPGLLHTLSHKGGIRGGVGLHDALAHGIGGRGVGVWSGGCPRE